jgi:hypothetical protein
MKTPRARVNGSGIVRSAEGKVRYEEDALDPPAEYVNQQLDEERKHGTDSRDADAHRDGRRRRRPH